MLVTLLIFRISICDRSGDCASDPANAADPVDASEPLDTLGSVTKEDPTDTIDFDSLFGVGKLSDLILGSLL